MYIFPHRFPSFAVLKEFLLFLVWIFLRTEHSLEHKNSVSFNLKRWYFVLLCFCSFLFSFCFAVIKEINERKTKNSYNSSFIIILPGARGMELRRTKLIMFAIRCCACKTCVGLLLCGPTKRVKMFSKERRKKHSRNHCHRTQKNTHTHTFICTDTLLRNVERIVLRKKT